MQELPSVELPIKTVKMANAKTPFNGSRNCQRTTTTTTSTAYIIFQLNSDDTNTGPFNLIYPKHTELDDDENRKQ